MGRPLAAAFVMALVVVSSPGALARAEGDEEADVGVPEPLASAFRPPPEFAGDLGAYRSPLIFDDGRPVRDAADWQERRREILATWHGIMGPWPPLIERPRVEVLGTERREGFAAAAGAGRGRPRPDPGRLPARARRPGAVPRRAGRLLRAGDRHRPGQGRGATSPTNWPGAASSPCPSGSTPSAIIPEAGRHGLQPLSYLAYVAANAYNALASLPEVDPKRVGVMGHSYGGKWAMFASCLYEKFACGVWSDPGVVFDETPAQRQLLGALVSRLGARPDPQAGRHHGGEPAHRGLQAAGRGGPRPARAARADGPAAVPGLRRLGGPARALAGAEPRRRGQHGSWATRTGWR